MNKIALNTPFTLYNGCSFGSKNGATIATYPPSVFARSKKFDCSSHGFRIFDIGCRNMCDTLCVDIFKIYLLSADK